jgi:hypothetical protein
MSCSPYKQVELQVYTHRKAPGSNQLRTGGEENARNVRFGELADTTTGLRTVRSTQADNRRTGYHVR